jgi:hypothetical protein
VALVNAVDACPKMSNYGKDFQAKLRVYKSVGWEVLLYGGDPEQPWWRWCDWGTKPITLWMLGKITELTPTFIRATARHLPFPGQMTPEFVDKELKPWVIAKKAIEQRLEEENV